ncbi:MAG: hypothetical protein ICV53_14110 [Flavisolibacter sp.]|nr:hypothetical protein [Flavisolibacter sp.]
MLQRLFHFFLFGHLFIALCAFVMALQTYYLFALPVYWPLLGFIVSGTLCSYGFHWYLTPEVKGGSAKVQWTLQHKKVHLFFFLIGLIGSCYFVFYLFEHWLALLTISFITFLYSAPKVPYPTFNHIKKFAIGKTIFLALVWMLVTTALPLISAHLQWQPEHYLFSVNRFFLIYPICILFDYRDREHDKTEGIRSMITYFDEQGIDRLFWASISVYFISTLALSFFSFSFGQTAVLLIPAFVLSLLYQRAKNSFSDFLYYFVLDGLMAISAFLLLPFL